MGQAEYVLVHVPQAPYFHPTLYDVCHPENQYHRRHYYIVQLIILVTVAELSPLCVLIVILLLRL